jgi:hypothetical protein
MTEPRNREIQREPLAISLNFDEVLNKGGLVIYRTQPFGPSGLAVSFQRRDRQRGSIIITQARHDGTEWLHASIALDTMPTYADLVLLHRAVFGRRRYAYQVFAPVDQHVNIHEHALHLFGRADGRPVLPEFSEGGSI